MLFRSCYSQITDLGNLQKIGGDAYFSKSQITDLGNLQTIGKFADFRNSQITDLGNLQTIGGEIFANGNKLTSEEILAHLTKLKGLEQFAKGGTIKDKVIENSELL